MNKIKGKETEQFSPWQQSFLNLVSNFNCNGVSNKSSKSKLKKPYFTIQTYRSDYNKTSRKQLGRTVLNTSKINLRSGIQDNLQEQLIVQQRSSRYQGPRLTFYSKMNPKCVNSSKEQLKSVDKKSLRYSFYQQQKSILTRDSSIKYLDIVQDNQQKYKNKEVNSYIHSIFPISTEKSLIIPRKREDDCCNMKRLKYLFNNRKLSNNY